MIVDYDNPTNNPFMAYRCPICFNPVSSCMTIAISNKKVCGCMTMSCKAPTFEQKDRECELTPLVKWNKWVIDYKEEYINWIEDMTGKTFDPSKESLSDYIDNNKQEASEEWKLRCELDSIARGY